MIFCILFAGIRCLDSIEFDEFILFLMNSSDIAYHCLLQIVYYYPQIKIIIVSNAITSVGFHLWSNCDDAILVDSPIFLQINWFGVFMLSIWTVRIQPETRWDTSNV